MNDIQNKRAQDLKKQFPGCMGRMVNLFDLSAGMAGNRLLTEKAHRDGTLFLRSQANVAKVLDSDRHPIEDIPIGHGNRRTSSNKKSNGTPMKMLIDQEMSRELESKRKPPSVVAKLMGLDALPEHQYDSAAQRFQDKREFKDVYEVWQQSPKTHHIRDKFPQKGSYNESSDERKWALVRQKFIEAKRLATDKNPYQSKEFQDALEVLSTNKDLLLKFWQEPNSLISQHLYELQSIPPPPQTRRITVLKPSKTVEHNREVEVNTWDKNMSGWSSFPTHHKPDTSTQPTRIVVLKPSHVRAHDIKTVISSPSSSPRLLHSKVPYGEEKDGETQGSRKVAKDEMMVSSMFSNGFVGDECSFNRSENEYIEGGNLSDSEVMTPSSRHSWDYVNRLGSPFSSSPFSRVSYSPDSSVCREAKKRLSERWAMMSSNGSGQEQRQIRRSSSTLGEMLSLSDTKKHVKSGVEGDDSALSISSIRPCGGEQELRAENLCLSSSRDEDNCGEISPRNLLRSRSVPVSSTAYGTRLNVEVPHVEVDKPFVPKEMAKSKSGKSSFKGKVSSLFFSRNKKPSKEKSGASLDSSKDGSLSLIAKMSDVPEKPHPGKITDDIPQCIIESCLEGQPSTNPRGSTGAQEEILSLEKPVTQGNSSETQDQPSPISVLEAAFEDDINVTLQSPGNNKEEEHRGSYLNFHSLKSNLIDKSPLIESIARSLSWDNDASSETATLNPLNTSFTPSKAEEEQEKLLLVKTLLHSYSLSTRWYSPESPLDPSLIDRCFGMKDNKQVSEAIRRYQRSNRRLIFDCVNAALVEIMGCESDSIVWTRLSSWAQDRSPEGVRVSVEEMWARVEEFFSSETKCFSDENGDNNSMVVRKEVVGRGCLELMRCEVDAIGKEIEGKMLEELVEEALGELTGEL